VIRINYLSFAMLQKEPAS